MPKLSLAIAAALVGALTAAQEPAKPAGPLALTLTLDKSSYAVGSDDIQAEVKLENTGEKDLEVSELVFEERSVSFHVKATWGGKVKEYDLVVTRPDPHVALRLPLAKVNLAKGKSLSMVHRIPVLAAGTMEIKAMYGTGASKLESAVVKADATGTSLVAVLDTTSGPVKMELDHENAPANVSNFVSLARRGFYDDLIFHRVVKGGWIQTGCPYGLGIGGPGWSVKGETSATAAHDVGTVSMAGGDKYGYIGSQFFICLSRLPAFDGKYTVIGKVDAGSIDKVQSIGKVEIDKNTDRPKSDVKVKKVTVSPK